MTIPRISKVFRQKNKMRRSVFAGASSMLAEEHERFTAMVDGLSSIVGS
jgi:hypothetical protein